MERTPQLPVTLHQMSLRRQRERRVRLAADQDLPDVTTPAIACSDPHERLLCLGRVYMAHVYSRTIGPIVTNDSIDVFSDH